MPAQDLSQLSLEQLGAIQVTSVSKRAEPLGQAASAIYVITHEDIVRSGATTLPEALRLAPNLQVEQITAGTYAISARGFDGNSATQSFSNKLLVLIDGRSVYTPVFAGVYWDMQDVLLEDVERIEVISGPGGALFGANAVNGVINVVTRTSSDTQGGFARAFAGDHQRGGALRYGGRVGQARTWRVYAKGVDQSDTRAPAGVLAHDHRSAPQGGFRTDWTPSAADTVTLQGDLFNGLEAQPGARAQSIRGGNVTSRWTHAFAPGDDLQVQAYYDREQRGPEVQGVALSVATLDIDVQDSLALGRHQIVWGGGARSSHFHIRNTATLLIVPPDRSLDLADGFVQDEISLTRKLRLILGAKLEDDPYVGAEFMPTARISWSPTPSANLWAAASRAVRAPTPLDRDVVEKVGGAPFLVGDPDFEAEMVDAYEVGIRVQPFTRASVSVSGFHNVYGDLRSVEFAPSGFLPLRWGNLVKGSTDGVDAWGQLELASWWRLTGGLSYLEKHLKFSPGSSRLTGVAQEGDDPKYRAQIGSSVNLGRRISLDGDLRYVSDLPNPKVPAYTELNGRVAWSVTDHLVLAVSGENLLHARHREYDGGDLIPRAVLMDVQWRF
ncbi:MAG: TonB-dependent receptor [Caulobacteraceae bacterium]|nr:TonB-dependent receptor [Caulobacteraceae bacterium]